MSNSQTTSLSNEIVRCESSVRPSNSTREMAVRGTRASTSSLSRMWKALFFALTMAISSRVTER